MFNTLLKIKCLHLEGIKTHGAYPYCCQVKTHDRENTTQMQTVQASITAKSTIKHRENKEHSPGARMFWVISVYEIIS